MLKFKQVVLIAALAGILGGGWWTIKRAIAPNYRVAKLKVYDAFTGKKYLGELISEYPDYVEVSKRIPTDITKKQPKRGVRPYSYGLVFKIGTSRLVIENAFGLDAETISTGVVKCPKIAGKFFYITGNCVPNAPLAENKASFAGIFTDPHICNNALLSLTRNGSQHFGKSEACLYLVGEHFVAFDDFTATIYFGDNISQRERARVRKTFTRILLHTRLQKDS